MVLRVGLAIQLREIGARGQFTCHHQRCLFGGRSKVESSLYSGESCLAALGGDISVIGIPGQAQFLSKEVPYGRARRKTSATCEN
ncbi:hypothetical protein ES705_08428 [subsurface metagenome]